MKSKVHLLNVFHDGVLNHQMVCRSVRPIIQYIREEVSNNSEDGDLKESLRLFGFVNFALLEKGNAVMLARFIEAIEHTNNFGDLRFDIITKEIEEFDKEPLYVGVDFNL